MRRPGGLATTLFESIASLVAALGAAFARGFDRAGVIETSRFRATIDLAWPRIVTGFAIMSKQTADLAMVGWVLGPPAVAGLAFAHAYWSVAKFLSIGLAGGTVSLVSQNYGGGENDRAALVVKQSVWVALALAIPIVAGYAHFAEPLIALLGTNPVSIEYGAVYLVIVAPALLFEFLNMVASRTFAGIGDTFTPMVVRAGGAALNILLSAVFIFGFDMGVAGAALGTAISIALITVVLSWGMFGRSYFGRGASPVPLTIAGPQVDGELIRTLLRISTPLMARRVAEGVVAFPLLAIAATFGDVVVAAYEVGRRVRQLVNSFSWGFSIASSTLVGQRLGAGEETEAEAYGREIISLSLVAYVAVAALVILLAEPIARVFVDEPDAVSLARTFVQVAAVSVVFLGVDGSATGALRGAGDTSVPFYASLLGLYVFALPIAWVGTITALGVAALYLALVVETLVPALVNVRRFRTDKWKAVSRSYRPSPGD
ncbi:MATE family efflux transporter [Haloferacaceae archaeon DSL9]